MKKKYFAPEMEIVELDMLQPILTGSLPMVSDPGSEIDDPSDILAPGLNIENELFGFEF